ncbi:enoyl-CoA hydratase/isomerase family protein [Solicola gregarius]|uniref:Enoyl-CoA hydratase-related protein n=1 Tax=Solicola gregarius TaxID=2908642 RepID=A0AA46TIV8_9ACTN|nr:enoyl-CoA hydratase-related protein [Solicola gregarius]UYM06174.1 enoyl-CoA hydratase-related protein [Solicola gregarius]
MTDSPDAVVYDVSSHVATITLNRPDTMNSLTVQARAELKEALHRAAADTDARAVVLTGTGRAFCVGQDLKEHVANLRDKPIDQVWSVVAADYSPMVTAIATMPKPVIAAVNGAAAGAGASLAFAADFRVLAEPASFNLAFANIALSCDTGASWTLPRLIGHAKATELLMLPRTVRSEEARSIGLATSVVPAEELTSHVRELALKLAAGPTLAYASIRRALAYSATHSMADSLEHEGQKMALTGASSDHKAAVAAFLDKETPNFEGH